MQTIVYQCDTAMPAQKLPNCCYSECVFRDLNRNYYTNNEVDTDFKYIILEQMIIAICNI